MLADIGKEARSPTGGKERPSRGEVVMFVEAEMGSLR